MYKKCIKDVHVTYLYFLLFIFFKKIYIYINEWITINVEILNPSTDCFVRPIQEINIIEGSHLSVNNIINQNQYI